MTVAIVPAYKKGTAMGYRAQKGTDIHAKLVKLVGEEGAKQIGVCQFCSPEELRKCKVVCKFGSSGIVDLFVPRHNPAVMQLRLETAAKEHRRA